MQISVTVTGSEAALARLRKTEDGVADLGPAMKEIGEFAASYFAGQAFISQGTVFGDRWPRLNPQYEQQKDKQYPGAPILVRTGLMRRSFESEYTHNSATVFNNTEWFKYHQSDQPRTKIPRRVMMASNDYLRNNAYAILGRYVSKAAGL